MRRGGRVRRGSASPGGVALGDRLPRGAPRGDREEALRACARLAAAAAGSDHRRASWSRRLRGLGLRRGEPGALGRRVGAACKARRATGGAVPAGADGGRGGERVPEGRRRGDRAGRPVREGRAAARDGGGAGARIEFPRGAGRAPGAASRTQGAIVDPEWFRDPACAALATRLLGPPAAIRSVALGDPELRSGRARAAVRAACGGPGVGRPGGGARTKGSTPHAPGARGRATRAGARAERVGDGSGAADTRLAI